ncbi:hypothetical protein IRJ41_004970 [Triplophysa rosa]|uniref:Uncharacterized protein n=1 Tax=Triplophysa rosa TaxID=992332 RepID=A0A9W7TVL1_TRIRA|nr:hypothetical protein IRJ41_004970 [Triplophysa rosa]
MNGKICATLTCTHAYHTFLLWHQSAYRACSHRKSQPKHSKEMSRTDKSDQAFHVVSPKVTTKIDIYFVVWGFLH